MRHIIHEETCRIATDSPHTIRVGESSWDVNDVSVKYTTLDSLGRIARTGEVPVWALPQMLEAAIRAEQLVLS